MTTNNNTQFDKAVDGIKKMSMPRDKKERVLGTLMRYADAHPAPERVTLLATVLKYMRSLRIALTPHSWK